LTLGGLFVKTRIVERPRAKDPRLFILIAVLALAMAIRLIAIGQPFVDTWSWRQSDVAAIARNYSQNGFHFAYPQIDWAGGEPGYVGTEFPILPFLTAILYKATGVHEWIGRIESVLFFALSLPFFFLLTKAVFGDTAAIWASVFYGFTPLSIMTSRCFMPDMASLSLAIIGLYLFRRWLAKQQGLLFFGAAVLVSLALLIKLPIAVIGVPLGTLAFQRFGWQGVRRRALWIFAAIAIMPSVCWYWHAADVARRFYPHHFFGAGGVQIMPARWYWDILQRIVTTSFTIGPIVLAMFGMFLAKRVKGAAIFYGWFAVMILFVIVVGYGNRHPWYQLPLVPVVAAFAGYAMERAGTRLQNVSPRASLTVAILVVALFIGQSYSATRKLYRPTAADLRALGLTLKSTTPPNSLIIAADYGDPTWLYYAERKGWHFLEKDAIYNGHPVTGADAIADLEKLRREGATHVAFYPNTFWWLELYPEFAQHLAQTATLVDTPAQYKVYELRGH
jgi:4-amino-4-deoxy-L-arabinose transferase-like glycosyltransferase